jgi:type II secretory pathway component GspD/PulD (secretin)
MRKRDMHTENRIFRLKYITAADASVLLKPMMSSNGAMALTPAAAGGIDTTATGGNSYSTDDTLVVSDYPGNLNEMTAALTQIDVRPKQVLIEATILNASLNDNNALGIDLLSVSGVDFSSLTSAALTNNTSGSTSTGTGTGATALNGPGGIINNFLGTGSQTNVSTDFAGKVPQGGLSIGFLSNHFAIFMRALEEVTDTTIVANPKILALNKQRGEVHIGQKLGYLTTTTSATTTNQTVQFMDVGTKLIFRPFIHDDGHISMEIHPEDSSGFIDSKGIPQTNTTEVTSTLDIIDGHTIVIGGLFGENTTAAKGQVPILGNIPILGLPFRRTNDTTTRQETIVLVTPHIINDDTSYYEESLKEAEDVSRIQLGNRADLQPWGRDRIAHIWYVKAQEEFQNGNKDKALMYTDWSLNTNPRLLESIKLREQITSRKMDELKGSSVSELVKGVLSGDAATTPDKGTSGVYPPAATTTAPATAPAK